jgi:hypothetical protein
MKKLIFFLAFVLPLLPRVLGAQDTARYKVQENFKREIVIGDKRYRVYNNWVSGGAGPAWHSANPRTQLVIGVNYNFHIHQYYFRLGGMIGGDNFAVRNNYQVHAAWIPYRKETEKYNLALMGGISYSTGYRFIYAGHYDVINPYKEVGGYAEAQWIKKIYYDVGIGGAFFVNVNQYFSVIGVRFDAYFSGAYRGYVRGKEPPKR